MIKIGPYTLNGNAVLAPMAGVTDLPFRQLCLEMGAAMVTGEMTSSNPALRNTAKSRLREACRTEVEPRTVQIAGTNPQELATAAEYHVSRGAQIIDINMGCPAKKVCKKLAGSALMRDEALVKDILHTVTTRVTVPVTLKIRTGWDKQHRNAIEIAKIAEQAGIQSLAVHGRTRECRFKGEVEYDTIASVVEAVKLPVFANGDINSAAKAKTVLEKTGAAGIMIGRAAQGRPWIFSEINALLRNTDVSCAIFNGKSLNSNDAMRFGRLIIKHMQMIYAYYGQNCNEGNTLKSSATGGKINNFPADLGIKVARKHICWYFEQLKNIIAEQRLHDRTREYNDHVVFSSNNGVVLSAIDAAKRRFNGLNSETQQLDYLTHFFQDLRTIGDIAA